MLVLEANDAEVALLRDGEVVCSQPGVALVDGREVLFGDDALARSRLSPRQVHNEYWQRLNADPVAPRGAGVANQADLVYLQLQALRGALPAPAEHAVEVVVAAPPTASSAQLSLLLGIAGEAGFQVTAFVDAAVAAASSVALSGPTRLLDMGLHRATITTLALVEDANREPRVCRQAVDEVPATGFATLLEGWIDAVADRFVESTRFDPLRVAETEQQVCDQVRAGVEQEASEFAIAVQHGDSARQITISRRTFAEKAEQRYGALARAIGAPGALLVTHRAGRPPGLVAHLEAAGHRVLPLPKDALSRGLAAHAERWAQADAVRHVTSLPARAAAQTPAASSPRPATHLLCRGVALPLGGEMRAADHPAAPGATGFRVKPNAAGFAVVPTAADVRFNGEPFEFERAAGIGDVIRAGGLEFHFIAVVGPAPRTPAQRR